ncbi:MAG TPA: sensor histidine kinase [Flavobacteriia bacterium]|nr:sensor histidine kinase [Flavobacteriia bacterium]
MKLKKTYKFAVRSAIYITFFFFFFAVLVSFVISNNSSIVFIGILSIFIFILSFLIIQYRVERFIYKRVKKIYDEVSLLSIKNIDKKNITTDMETLSEKVKKFAEDKRLEIEMLQIREEYRREFIGNVSHELKTPLFTVQGYLLTLQDGAMEDESVRKKYLKRANKGVERLISIVKDLDMISKLESSNLNPKFEVFNCIAMIQNVFDLLEIKAKKRNISLAFDKMYETPILVKGDVKQIEQVLTNLIENSIKYGKTNGKTLVGVHNYSSHQFIIKINDDGEGIEEHHLSRLFERFYRVDQSRSREQGGSGLGLAIVKHILEAHQQEVFVESTPGIGTSFSFTLEKVQ